MAGRKPKPTAIKKLEAATCQTSYDFRESDKSYDLVIIDEAARANPLDLSMGKKIVMVGDHKQLPRINMTDFVPTMKSFTVKFESIIPDNTE